MFLHEGLGSLSMWNDFPARLCDAAGLRGLVFSRPGYGRSTPRAARRALGADFMHEQAREVLPALLAALGIDTEADRPGCSATATADRSRSCFAATFPRSVAGVVALAPHIFVEDVSIASIGPARAAYLRAATCASGSPAITPTPTPRSGAGTTSGSIRNFAAGTSSRAAATIVCPVLAVQGEDDEYGTLAQIQGIGRAVPQAKLLALADCGHAVHRDQPDRVTRAVVELVARHTRPMRSEPWTSPPS